jgi:hypothetical protein
MQYGGYKLRDLVENPQINGAHRKYPNFKSAKVHLFD